MHWNVDPTLFHFGGPFELRYYGLLFALVLFLAAYHGPRYFRVFGIPAAHAERLALWVPVGMLLGAHYIHLIFYEPAGLSDMRLGWEDGHAVVGRFWNLGSGLASHGGALGCIIALFLFWRAKGKPLGLGFHRYTDAVMPASVWVYPFVRLGNFMNSEIVGRETDVPWGVIFDRYYTTARHPVQLYEAALYFGELFFATWLVKNRTNRFPATENQKYYREGVIFYLLLGTHFSLRFFAEFFKESQHIDEGWALNMGHLLSAPIVVLCAILLLGTKRFSILTPLTQSETKHNDDILQRAKEREATELSDATKTVS